MRFYPSIPGRFAEAQPGQEERGLRSFELTTHIDNVSRSKGKTATVAAAYISGTDIYCEYEQRQHRYSGKGGVAYSHIFLPSGAPEWAKDRQKLWNAAELVEKNGKRGKNAGQWKAKARTAGTYLFSFPHELSAAGRQAVTDRIAQYLVDRDGVAADANIHAPGREGDQRNWHCHIQTTTRVLTAKGLGKKAAGENDLKLSGRQSKAWRAFVAQTINDELKKEGKAHLVKVEHKSFKARGIQRQPTRHQGPARTNVKRKQRRLEREAWEEQQRTEQQERQAKEAASLKLKQDFASQRMKAKHLQEYRELKARLKQEVIEAREKDKVEGARRWFLAATGKLVKAEFEREQRHGARVEEARERLEKLENVHRMEVRTFERGQGMEREDLQDRHAAENRQLEQAVQHREDLDHAREQQDRQPPEQIREREQYQGRELRLDFQ